MAEDNVPQKKKYKQRAFKPIPEKKACSRCEAVLPKEAFYIRRYTTMTGRRSVMLSAECRECHQKPMRRGGIKPAQPLRSESACNECGETKPIGQFPVKKQTAKRGTVSFSVSGRCKACSSKRRRKPSRKLKAILPLPAERPCIECGETKPASDFYVCKDKTSTGRPKLKLKPRCKLCQSRIESEKKRVARIGRPRRPSRKKFPLDQPKRCTKCGEVKAPSEFPTCKRKSGDIALYSRCKSCGRIRATPAQAAEYTKKRREAELSDPALRAEKKRYAAEHFQANKERIRLRNIEARRRDPEKARIRAVANIMRRRAFGCDKRIAEVRQAISETLESYRIGDQYWDAYESKLIDNPSVDHILAVTRGGTNSVENLTLTGRATNSSKGVLPLLVWLARRAARERKTPWRPDGVVPETQIPC